MLAYWAQEMEKIKDFKCLNRITKIEGQLLSILGFSRTTEGVTLHILERLIRNRELVSVDMDRPLTHRRRMSVNLQQKEEHLLWTKKVYFGNREYSVKSAYSRGIDSIQIETIWILAEAFRQGWYQQDFEEVTFSDLDMTTIELDMAWEDLDFVLNESTVRFERKDAHKTVLVEAKLELPIEENYFEPVVVNINKNDFSIYQTLIIYGIELRDVWQDFEELYNFHRLNNTFSEETLEQYKLENERNLETICPRGMRFAVVTYEAEPHLSIECHTTAYLDSLEDYRQNGTASAMSIMFNSNGEKGRRGFALRKSVIYYPLSPDTKMLEFEIFKFHRTSHLPDLVFSEQSNGLVK